MDFEFWSLGSEVVSLHTAAGKHSAVGDTLNSYSMESKSSVLAITTSSWHRRHDLSKETVSWDRDVSMPSLFLAVSPCVYFCPGELHFRTK